VVLEARVEARGQGRGLLGRRKGGVGTSEIKGEPGGGGDARTDAMTSSFMLRTVYNKMDEVIDATIVSSTAAILGAAVRQVSGQKALEECLSGLWKVAERAVCCVSEGQKALEECLSGLWMEEKMGAYGRFLQSEMCTTGTSWALIRSL
jgi:hypothetical protein